MLALTRVKTIKRFTRSTWTPVSAIAIQAPFSTKVKDSPTSTSTKKGEQESKSSSAYHPLYTSQEHIFYAIRYKGLLVKPATLASSLDKSSTQKYCDFMRIMGITLSNVIAWRNKFRTWSSMGIWKSSCSMLREEYMKNLVRPRGEVMGVVWRKGMTTMTRHTHGIPTQWRVGHHFMNSQQRRERVLVDTGSTVDILLKSAFDKLGFTIARTQ